MSLGDNTIILNDHHAMPRLGFGVWQIADEEAEGAVSMAINAGYRLIDTAMIYRNERGVGAALKKCGVPREKLFVTTKVWNDDQGFEKTKAAFSQSLARLKLDYVDLYLIHWPSPQRELFVETWQALIEMKKLGKIKSIGVSNFAKEHIERIMHATGEIPTVNQVELHPRLQQRALREFHQQHSIQTESWSPLGRGRLLSDTGLLEIAKKHKKSVAQIILRWHLQNNLIVIPKSVTPARIKENIEVFDFALDEDDLQHINKMDSPFGRIGPHPLQTDF